VRTDLRPLDLPFARSVHDRAADRRAEPGLVQRLLADPATRVLVLHRGRLAVAGDAHVVLAAPGEVGDLMELAIAATAPVDSAAATWLFLGVRDGAAYVALVLPDGVEPGDPAGPEDADRPAGVARAWTGLRELTALDDVEQGLAVEAVALAQWHALHVHCPRCGAPTVAENAGWTRRCTAETTDLYPRTDPAVIMAVVDDADRILLGHGTRWPVGRFSTLAGFVEPGEGLEQAVRREVLEETGVVVGSEPGDVVYRGSQSWPFPASLMVGFQAHATATAVRVDGEELSDARWFSRTELRGAVDEGAVGLPGRQSIARMLIEEWYGERLPGQW
jgi:NAD+ diphosphatase